MLKIASICKGSFRLAAFSMCRCSRQVWCGKLEKFLSLWKCNYLPQPDAENAAGLNEPYSHPTFVKNYKNGLNVHLSVRRWLGIFFPRFQTRLGVVMTGGKTSVNPGQFYYYKSLVHTSCRLQWLLQRAWLLWIIGKFSILTAMDCNSCWLQQIRS